MIAPNASAGAVSLYPRLAGTASSWVGLAQMGMGALGTVIVAVLTAIGSDYIALPLVVGLGPFAIATVLAARLIRVTPLAR
jgi:DHA1 family bicyclomycin/chloramphenicol resistance-like MFS transporter